MNGISFMNGIDWSCIMEYVYFGMCTHVYGIIYIYSLSYQESNEKVIKEKRDC